MGFTAIPDRDQEHTAVEDPSTSAIALLAYLNQVGVRRTNLAAEMGISKSLLSQYLNGRKAWTVKWQQRLHEWVARRVAGGQTVNSVTLMGGQFTN